ncbi:MAG: hypothetical protein ACKOX7_07175, partial [Bacteroidota bacterium]
IAGFVIPLPPPFGDKHHANLPRFYFYDLDNEQVTSLRIHPFAVMDATLKYYMRIKPEEAMDHIRPVIREVRQVNGDFISLWHNESLSENKIWAGWRDVYRQMVEEAV